MSSSDNFEIVANSLNQESRRLITFTCAPWPHKFISPKILAKTGCYYIGPNDMVKCYFCAVEIHSWVPGDDEVKEHLRWSPNCPFLKRRKTNNIHLGSPVDLHKLLPPLSFDIPETSHFRTHDNNHSAVTVPIFPAFASFQSRLRTFKDYFWPNHYQLSAENMSSAGFFYTGKRDRVICFHCGGGLENWKDGDFPLVEHAKEYGYCEFLMQPTALDII